MEQQIARKFIPTPLNLLEMTLTLDQHESSVTGYESESVCLRNNAQMGNGIHINIYVNVV